MNEAETIEQLRVLLADAIDEVDYLHSDKNGCLMPGNYPRCSICEWRWQAQRALDGEDVRRPAELLTRDELEAMDMTGELAQQLHALVGDGPTAAEDWNEFAADLHHVQHRILKQAAARAYPERFRLLGQTLVPQS